MRTLFIFFSLVTLAINAQASTLVSCNIISGPIAEVSVTRDGAVLQVHVLRESGRMDNQELDTASWNKKVINFIPTTKNPFTQNDYFYGRLQLNQTSRRNQPEWTYKIHTLELNSEGFCQ
jgi:hypothetical protein